MDMSVDTAVAPLKFSERLRVVAGAVVAILLLVYVGRMVALPADSNLAVTFTHSGRLLFTTWPALLGLTVVAGIAGTVIAGRRLAEAGMFAAMAGLAGLALQGGSMQSLLGYAVSPDTESRRSFMMWMGVDCLLWTALMVATWTAMSLIGRWLSADAEADDPEMKSPAPSRSTWTTGWQATVVTAIVAMFIIWLTIARTPVAMIARGQVVAVIFFALYLGAMAARYFTGVSRAHWYVAAVPIVALVGYLVGYLQADMSWAKGPWAAYKLLATTPPHALVRPLPIEYISIGVAGAIVGLWSGTTVEHKVQ